MPEPWANWDGTGERGGPAISLSSADNRGAHRPTDRFGAGERALRALRTGAPLCRHRILERLPLEREQVAEDNHGCAGHGATIGCTAASPAAIVRPSPVIAMVGPLHRPVLRDAHEGELARCGAGRNSVQRDKGCRSPLPSWTGQSFGMRVGLAYFAS